MFFEREKVDQKSRKIERFWRPEMKRSKFGVGLAECVVPPGFGFGKFSHACSRPEARDGGKRERAFRQALGKVYR